MTSGNMGGCRCPHHLGFGILVILFGLTFLLQAFGVFTAELVAYIWPSILIVGGLFKVIAGICSCCAGKMGGSCGGACGGACSTEGADEGCCSDDMKGSCCEEEEVAHAHEEKK